MIDALIAGRIYGAPAPRTTKAGKPYATSKVRAPTRDGESQFVNVVAFSNSAVTALLALADGDSAAISGELRVSIYTAADGTARVSLDLVAHAVLTEYHVARRRKAVAAGGVESAQEQRSPDAPSQGEREEFDDAIPF